MDSKRGIPELGSDYFREAAVLVAVFGLLDKAIKGEAIRLTYAAMIIGASAILFVIGCGLELLRRT